MEQKSHLRVLGFDVRFELWFWVTIAVMAARTENLERGLLWAGLVTVSILVHELGHALAYRYHGAQARITMWGVGGLTHGSNADHLTPQQRIVVAAAGSTFEMVTLGAPAWILQMVWSPGGWSGLTLHWLVWINVVWALVNLAPVWPMDGGHIIEEVLFLRSKRSRLGLVHRISIGTGLIAAAICLWQGLSWGAILFVFFAVLNLFAAGIWRTKTNVMLWPGVTTAGGGPKELPRARKATPKEIMNAGYASLTNGAPRLAQAEAKRAMSQSRSSGNKREAAEMLVWASVVAGDYADAASGLAELQRPSRSLLGAYELMTGNDADGIAAIAEAVQSEARLPASEQAILYAARSGHIRHVVSTLLDQGTAGLGHAVRIQYVLEAAQMDEALKSVESLI